MASGILKVSYIALAIVACTAENRTEAEQNLAAAQKQYEQTFEDAKSLEATLEAHVEGLRQLAANSTKIAQLGDIVLQKASEKVPSRQTMRSLRSLREGEKEKVRSMRQEAHTAWRQMKHWARQIENHGRHAGLPEHIYEGDFARRERFSEGMADHAENVGDRGGRYLNRIFRQIRRNFAQARRAAGIRQEQEEEEKEREEEKEMEDEIKSEASKAPSPPVQLEIQQEVQAHQSSSDGALWPLQASATDTLKSAENAEAGLMKKVHAVFKIGDSEDGSQVDANSESVDVAAKDVDLIAARYAKAARLALVFAGGIACVSLMYLATVAVRLYVRRSSRDTSDPYYLMVA